MKLVLAQGNPGATYAATRHNAGWICLDAIASKQGSDFQHKPKFHAHVADLQYAQEKVLFIKPTTFYNETGRVARALLDFYKLAPQDVLVLHDDLALPFGTVRVRSKGSDAGNNGVKSVTAHIGEHYTRLRLGIHNNLATLRPSTDFVLSKFSSEEQGQLREVLIPIVEKCIESFAEEGALEPTSYTPSN